MQRSGDDAARFWSKVHKTPSCWLWTAGCFKSGYGQFSIARGLPRGQQAPLYAHRYAWELARGPLPVGAHVLHSCDEPRCVRLDHLFLGNQDANMKDAAAKGRLHVPRPNHPRRKLSDLDVARIHEMRRGGMTLEAIGDVFSVTKACVSRIVNGHARTYVAPQLQQQSQKGAA